MAEHDEYHDESEDNEFERGCKRCGSTDCVWINTGLRWRLFDEGGKPHACGANADGFEDETESGRIDGAHQTEVHTLPSQ